MSYTAKSFEEIAALFDERAEASAEAIFGALTLTARSVYRAERAAWLSAADILRRTTITEPIHMEKQ